MSDEIQNQKITCIDKGKNPDCLGEFIWTTGDQEWYAARNLTTPKRCKNCRKRKREQFEKRQANDGRE